MLLIFTSVAEFVFAIQNLPYPKEQARVGGCSQCPSALWILSGPRALVLIQRLFFAFRGRSTTGGARSGQGSYRP